MSLGYPFILWGRKVKGQNHESASVGVCTLVMLQVYSIPCLACMSSLVVTDASVFKILCGKTDMRWFKPLCSATAVGMSNNYRI